MSSVKAEDGATMHKSVSASSKAEEYATEFAILVDLEGGDGAWIRFDLCSIQATFDMPSRGFR